MAEEFDVVIIGAGHNSLVCGGYMAKAGLKVGVFEQYKLVGGGAMTEEITVPGWKHNNHSQQHNRIHAGPVIQDLDLYTRHGLKYIVAGGALYACVFSDGGSIVMYDDLDLTCKQIEKYSKRDAKAYREFVEEYRGIDDIMSMLMFVPAPAYWTLFQPLEESHEGRALLRLILSSQLEVVNDRFESDELRVMMMWMSAQGGVPADTKGTGVLVPEIATRAHTRPWAIAEGGSISLALALTRCIEAHGGVVRTSCSVDRVIVENGVATGVELRDGTTVKARKAIISAAGAAQTVLNLVGDEYVPDWVAKYAREFRWEEQVLCTPHFALKSAPHWKAAETNPDVDKCWQVGFGADTVAQQLTQFEDLRANRVPSNPGGLALIPTIQDPTQAPPGCHSPFYWQFTCYNVNGNAENWDSEDFKAEIMASWQANWQKHMVNLTDDNIAGKALYTPRDIERHNPSFRKASIVGGDLGLAQMFAFRPWPGMSDYSVTGVEQLYLCQASSHPHGAITGAVGYNLANKLAEDLKIKKWWGEK